MFEIKLYSNTAETNRVDKTNFLTLKATLQGNLKEKTSIINPIINFELSDVPDFNYVYIAEFNRYYFITDIKNISNNLWEISMRCDVLMSFKTEILTNPAILKRTADTNYSDPYLIDSEYKFETPKDIEYIEIGGTPFIKQGGLQLDNIIISVVN